MDAVVRVGRALNEALAPAGMNLISSAGKAAEQTVFHLHLHVVPRWPEDGFGRIWPPERALGEPVKRKLAAQVREACAAQE
jgi:histidine triad (HIT) family protein